VISSCVVVIKDLAAHILYQNISKQIKHNKIYINVEPTHFAIIAFHKYVYVCTGHNKETAITNDKMIIQQK